MVFFYRSSLNTLTPLTTEKIQRPLQKLLFSATLTQNPEKLALLQLFKPRFFTVSKSKDIGENTMCPCKRKISIILRGGALLGRAYGGLWLYCIRIENWELQILIAVTCTVWCVDFLNSLLYLYMPYIRLCCAKNRIIKFAIAYFQRQNLAVVLVLVAIVKSKAPQRSKARNYKFSITNFSHYFQKYTKGKLKSLVHIWLHLQL